MKKTLLGTTAVAAAGLIASPALAQDGQITLSLGGYYNNWVSFIDQEDEEVQGNIGVAGTGTSLDTGTTARGNDREFNPVRVRHEGEIHFGGSTTLDNGLTVGFQAQLEAITQGDQFDETFLFFQGSWGRLVMGSENSAAYLMQYVAPNTGIPGVNTPSSLFATGGGYVITGTTSPTTAQTVLINSLGGSATTTAATYTAANLAMTSTYLNGTSDANKITYFTPRFGGFQLGVSYTPDVTARGGSRRSIGLDPDKVPGGLNHSFAIGANFVETFGSVDIALAGGFEYANLQKAGGSLATTSSPAGGNTVNVFDEDHYAVSTGLNIGYGGFVFGASFAHIWNNFGIEDLDRWGFDVGASYSTGPWTLSATYFYGEANYEDHSSDGVHINTNTEVGDEDRRHLADISVAYALSPGVTISATGQYFYEDTNILASAESEGFGVSVGTSLSF